jgi:ABC-type polysaccharide/polyol phosphate export permease
LEGILTGNSGLATHVTNSSPSLAQGRLGGLAADLADIARDLWRYRDLLHQLTLRDIRIRYKQAVMGFGWALLMPALIVLSGFIVRSAISYLSGTALERADLGAIAVKSLPWAFFVGAIGFSNVSLVANINLVTKIYFPREVLPLSAVLAQGFDTAVGAAALTLALPLLGVQFSAALLWVPVLVVMLFLFTAAVALLLSCANLFFRDVKYIVQILLTFGIFFTPVFFDSTMFGSAGARVMMLNPLAPILEGFRHTIIGGHNLLEPLRVVAGSTQHLLAWSPWYLAYSGAWALIGLIASSTLFHRLEFLFAEYA